MAEGNIGSLWMSLGLKDEVSKALKKIAQGMDGVDAATKEAQDKLLKLAETAAEGKNINFLNSIKKALGENTEEAKELQAVLDAIKSIKGGWGKMTKGIDLSDVKQYNELLTAIERSLTNIGMKSGLSEMGDNMHDRVTELRSGLSILKDLRQEASKVTNLDLKKYANPQEVVPALHALAEEARQMASEYEKALLNPKKALDELAALSDRAASTMDNLRERRNAIIVNDANIKLSRELEEGKQQEEIQAKKTAEAVEQQAQAEKKAAEAIEQKAAAQKKANETAQKTVKRQPAVENKDFSQTFKDVKAEAEKAGKSVSKMLDTLLDGKGSAGMSMHEIAKKAADYSKELAEIDTTLKRARDKGKTDGMKGDPTKDMREQIKNAQTFLGLIQQIDLKQKQIAQKRAEQPNVNTKELERANTLMERFGATLMDTMRKGNVDGSAVMGNFPKALQMTMKEVGDVMSQFAKDNPMSVFTGGADKANVAISNLETKIKDLQRLMDEGAQKGFKTDMLPENIRYMQLRLTELNRLFGDNWQKMTDKPYMNNLFSDIAKTMTLARNAEHEYGKEKARTIAVTKAQEEAQRKADDEASKEYDRKKRQAEAAKKAQDDELKAMSDYAKRYMELQEAKRKADEKAAEERKRQSDAEKKRIETDTRRMSGLYAQMGVGIGKAERAGMAGLGLGVNTAALDKALGEATELRRKIEDTNIALMGKGGREGYGWYEAQVRRVKVALDEATQSQKELNREKERSDKEAKKKKDRDDAQKKREDAAAERQRQSELKITEARINSVTEALKKMQEARLEAKGLGADTTVIDQEIAKAKQLIAALSDINTFLRGKDWHSSLGVVGNTGDGRSVAQLKQVAADQAKVNAEIAQSAELERKHRQEVARTAAKVRTDLVRSIDQAKEKSVELLSAWNDLKGLLFQGGIVYGLQSFARSIIQTGGEIEQQHIALQSILGDTAKANELFAQTQQLALQSPFKFDELNKDVKQLAAFGVEANDLYDTTKRLADIASGLGVSFERLGLAYGQVKARAWLDGKELRQFAYAGLPMLQKITDMYNKEGKNGRNDYTTGDVKKMISSREVSFEDVQKVLWNLTSEGGQFYNMQLVLSETLLGRWNKLIDAWDIMLGKFASGNNILGAVFKTGINGAVELVQQMDKLSPLLVSFAGVYGLKRLGGAIGSKIGAATGLSQKLAQLKAAQLTQLRTYALEQQELVVAKQITQAEATKNVMKRAYMLAEKETTATAMQQLAIEGKLSLLQMQKAVRQGLITPELISQLEVMGLISAKESELILKTNGIGGAWARVRLGATQAWGSIKGLFTWGNMAMVGVGAAVGLWLKHEQDMEEIESRARDISQSALSHAEAIKEALKSADGTDMSNSAELSKANDELKEVLEQSGYYTDTIRDQVEGTSSLVEQYKALKKAVEESQQAASDENTYSKAISEAIGESGDKSTIIGSYFNDDIIENVSDVQNALNSLDLALQGLDASTKKRLESVADSFLKPEERAKSLEEKLMILAGRGSDYDELVRKVSNGSNEIGKSLYTIQRRAVHLNDQFGEIANDDLPKIIKTLAMFMGKTEGEFKTWAQHNVSSFDNMFMKIVRLCNTNTPLIVQKLREIMYAAVDMKAPEPQGSGKPKGYTSGLAAGGAGETARQRLIKSGKITAGGKRKGSFGFRETDALLRQLDSMQYEEFGENLRKKYKEIRNENDARKNAKVSPRNKRQQDILEAVASEMGISLDVGKNKVTGNYGKDKGDKGNQKDEELDQLKARLSDFKAARQMYQKLVKETGMGKQAARSKTVKLFPDLDWKNLDLDNYEGSVRRLREGFNFDKSTERKKFMTQIDREAADWEISEKLKPEFERVAANFKEALEKGVSQANLEQELLEKTGNKDFAGLAWLNGAVWDEHTRAMLKDFQKEAGTDIDLNMTDADAKKLYENNWRAYTLWQKITTIVKDKYVKSLQSAADIMAETATTEEKLRAIDAKYAEKISQARASGDNGLAERYTLTRDKEKGQVRNEAFKGSTDYLMFFEAIDALGRDKAQEIATQIRSQLNRALADGSLDAREYAKQIAQVEEQLEKLGNGRKTIWNAGFQGAAEQKTADGLTKYNAGSIKLQEGEKMKREGKIEGDLNKQIKGDGLILAGRVLMQAGTELQSAGRKIKDGWEGAVKTMNDVDQNIQGIVSAFGDVKDTMGALGFDTDSDGWQDATAVMNSLSGMSTGVKNAISGFATGDYGGAIAGAISVVTSPIKAFAAAHDAKLDRQIKLAERNITELERTRDYVKSILDKTLGGVYEWKMDADTRKTLDKVLKSNKYTDETKEAASTALDDPTNAYKAERATLLAQRDEMQRQRDSEDKKKKKDKDKLADYDEELKQMNLTIKQLSTDFLKDIYGVDMKSWASQLTDAVVSAWEKGEDAMDAYRKKAKEMVKDLTKNILSQKIMEKALEGPLDYLTGIIEEKGKLEDSDMPKLIDDLTTAGENATYNITKILDGLKAKGYDFSESGSGTVSNSVKNITEETADVLASYLNACRADVAMIRKMQGQYLPEMSETTKAQLVQLSAIATNTLRTAQASESIKVSVEALSNNIERVINGVKKIHVQ